MNAVLKPVAGAGRQRHAGGRPRGYDRDALAREFERYIETTAIPIIAEFASERGLHKQLLYGWPEFLTLIKTCTTKKEAALERAMLNNEVNTVGAIFSLKQLGWSDRLEQTNKDANMAPEDMQAHLEGMAHNLEKLCVRTHMQAGIEAKALAEAAPSLQGKR